jgi:glycosyltransferase involved in cell wall biosynthesis
MRSMDTPVRLPLRVAIVAPTHAILGGHSVQAQQMLDGWRGAAEVEAWLVPINPSAPAPFTRAQSIRYARTLVTQACYWPLLVRELRRADVVHVFSASFSGFLLSTAPAMLVARALGKPVVLNYHGGEAREHLSGSAIARWMLRRLADRHVVPSSFLREVFRDFGIAADVVPNTIDLQRFAYRVRDPLRPHLLSTRNFEGVYNVACTLEAFALVQRQIPEATLTLVGAGPDRARLQAMVEALGIEHVTFAGRVAPEEMPRYYAAADIYVQTPAADNMPVSVLEAFASGLPVVSTEVGGVPAVLADGVHGLLACAGDAGHVAERILHLLAHPGEARRLASAAHEGCGAYQWAAVRDRWLAAYRASARGPSRGAIPVEAA